MAYNMNMRHWPSLNCRSVLPSLVAVRTPWRDGLVAQIECLINRDLDYVHSKPDSLLCRQEIYPVKYEHHLSERRSFTLKIDAVQLRSVTEIAPKLPFSCVNRSPIRYNFRSGAKAIPHSVNVALHDWFIWFSRLILSNASRTEIAWSP